MSQKQTKKTNLELKKPSELCQVLFYSDFNKKDYAYLTSLQIDLVSTIFYLISDVMNKQKLVESDIFDWSSINHFEIKPINGIHTLVADIFSACSKPSIFYLTQS